MITRPASELRPGDRIVRVAYGTETPLTVLGIERLTYGTRVDVGTGRYALYYTGAEVRMDEIARAA